MRPWILSIIVILCIIPAFVVQTTPDATSLPQQTYYVQMRDGVLLETNVWTPGPGKYPAVLSRGYSSNGPGGQEAFNNAGYAFVAQLTRGNGGEDGSRFFPDDLDGYDTIEWIVQQPWSNGEVAMWGGSYWGITQWRAALAGHPALKAIIPGYTNPELWKCGYWCTGALHLKMTTQGRALPDQGSLDDWKNALLYLPLIDMDLHFTGSENILWNDYITHSSYDDYWKELGMLDGNKYQQIHIPVYNVAGWRDYYAGGVFEAYNELKKLGYTDEIRASVYDGGHSGQPDITESIKWLDWVIKGIDNDIKNQPPIRIAVRHGEMKFAYEWPLPETEFTDFYLSSPDGSRLGHLSTTPPGNETSTNYIYNPADPVLTLGANGSHVYPEVPGLIVDESVDQRPNESRQDVLVFTSSTLEEDTEIIGPITAKLYAASSARDTDFTIRLIDVYPDGQALNVTEGIVRARFRNSIFSSPSLITPRQIYEYDIELLPIAIVLKKGHKIRVHVSSSNWPLFDRNQNTGNPIGLDAQIEIAEQTIYHDSAHPSHIKLPIIRPVSPQTVFLYLPLMLMEK